jgi:hypothetical protein
MWRMHAPRCTAKQLGCLFGNPDVIGDVVNDEPASLIQSAEGSQSSLSAGSTGPPAAATGGAERFSEQDISFVFALGRVAPRFPSPAVEKEFAQAVGRASAEGLTDNQALKRTLSDRANRYIARQMCWVFLIEGIETYLLTPRDPVDLELLIEAVREDPRRDDVDIVIGPQGPIAPPEACNGLQIPIVVMDQLYSFDRDSLIEGIPRPEDMPEGDEQQFRDAAGELFDRIMQLADNSGALDEHRALNYLAVRYPAIYATTAEAHSRNRALSGVEGSDFPADRRS